MTVRRCKCCGEEYDIDNCRCRGWCDVCSTCELHCAGPKHLHQEHSLEYRRIVGDVALADSGGGVAERVDAGAIAVSSEPLLFEA